jgi:hypothetical protein
MFPMTILPDADEVRQLVRSYFRQLGVNAEDVTKMEETTRVDRGRIVSHSYRAAELFSMWLVEVGILQFYDRDGEMLMTVNLFERLEPKRMAA